MLKNRRYNNLFLSLLSIFFLIAATSCKEDDILQEPVPEEIPGFEDVYALNFVVTVDNMGTRAASVVSDDPAQITRNENYINLERFRVLFFDEQDYFIFESKNRWVKQVDAGDQFSSWYVSVPLGAFGNDSYGEGMEYNWDEIKNKLTSQRFKIAILANRPAQLLYPGNFADSELTLPDGIFDNDGPYWGPAQSGVKTIFDLHHYQYDIIYADKGNHKNGAAESYYDFIMGENNTDRPTMGSAINWVSFDNNDTDKELLSGTNYMRNIKMPGEGHPIPMYGIQIFDPIPKKEWKKGSAFDLSNLPEAAYPQEKYDYQSISLLRCCVRLDLRIPKSVMKGEPPIHVSLWYSNIYSRTEPMDTWTPTNQIWKDNHNSDCEWLSIRNYGPVSSNSSPGNGTTKEDYQKRMSWFYGAWLDKKWPFKTRDNKTVPVVAEGSNTKYPRIFNTCIQRNKAVRCNNGNYSSLYNDNYWHYVVYTGERNINDPNTLPNMTKNPYIITFLVSWDNKKYYCIPLVDYSNGDADLTPVFGPHTYDVYANANTPGAYNTYMNTIPSKTGNKLPYPLLRNHIYRFTLKGTKSGEEDGGLFVNSEVIQTEDINFSKQVERARINKGFNNATVSPAVGVKKVIK